MEPSLELLRKELAEEVSKHHGANQAWIAQLRENITLLAATASTGTVSLVVPGVPLISSK